MRVRDEKPTPTATIHASKKSSRGKNSSEARLELLLHHRNTNNLQQWQQQLGERVGIGIERVKKSSKT